MSDSPIFEINSKGTFYNHFVKKTFSDQTPLYSTEDQQCIENTVTNLVKISTSDTKPGLLLGKIQSGKTRTFIGVIALCFDNDFDVAVVLTKNSSALAEQTCKRLGIEFQQFIKEKAVVVHDVMNLPRPVPKFYLQQKMLFVAKKESANIKKLIELLSNPNGMFYNKKVLLIDDEADNASVGYKGTGEQQEMARIADFVNNLRSGLKDGAFLQVTATPYSLFLQNEDAAIPGTDKLCLRPAFTTCVPVHKNYIGGEYYFEQCFDKTSSAAYVHKEISLDELKALKKKPNRNGFKLEIDALTSTKIHGLRNAIVSFIVAGCIRHHQMEQAGGFPAHFSFLIHTEAAKGAHSWQQTLTEQIITDLTDAVRNNKTARISELVKEAYDDLAISVSVAKFIMPSFEEVLQRVEEALQNDWVHIAVVNSDQDVSGMLDETGQLNLASPLNIFIGGQYLDRGVTIDRLLGFFYGRAPKRYQQDTVLQHSRMYGARPAEDCAVTRFYTTSQIYAAMAAMHKSDSALRERIEKGDVEESLHFIERDPSGKIVPCGIAKIRASKQLVIKPHSRMLPNGFQTVAATQLKKITARIDAKLEALGLLQDAGLKPVKVDLDLGCELLSELADCFCDFMPEMEGSWLVKDHIALLKLLSRNSRDTGNSEKIGLMIRTGRKRPRQINQPLDTPDNPSVDTAHAREFAQDMPVLALFKQSGCIDLGWTGSAFWWPVIYSPKNSKTYLFAQGNTAGKE